MTGEQHRDLQRLLTDVAGIRKALEIGQQQRLAVIALNIFAKDQHRFTTRPCQTCDTITTLVGEPFGCIKMAHQVARAESIHKEKL